MDLKAYLKQRQALVNKALERYLPPSREYPGSIHQAMRYSVLGEGKRIRPILVLAACEAVGGSISSALQSACALELIHAYSLVHDDLPAMDDDDWRRGKPSCHKKYGEAVGVLTGDALLTYSFELLACGNGDSGARLKVIREIAKAIGTQGMIGGQVVDVEAGRSRATSAVLEYINTRKTGALISASVRVGALLGCAGPKAYKAMALYGGRIGLVFQLVDDLLDGDGAVRIHGAEAVRKRAERLTRSAVACLAPFGEKTEPLRELAEFILVRNV